MEEKPKIPDLIDKIAKIRKSLKPSLVRKQEQLKGIEWLFASGLIGWNIYNEPEILKAIRKRYLK
jgi:hypothetical protein